MSQPTVTTRRNCLVDAGVPERIADVWATKTNNVESRNRDVVRLAARVERDAQNVARDVERGLHVISPSSSSFVDLANAIEVRRLAYENVAELEWAMVTLVNDAAFARIAGVAEMQAGNESLAGRLAAQIVELGDGLDEAEILDELRSVASTVEVVR